MQPYQIISNDDYFLTDDKKLLKIQSGEKQMMEFIMQENIVAETQHFLLTLS